MIKPSSQYLLCALKAYVNGLQTAEIEKELEDLKDDISTSSPQSNNLAGPILIVALMLLSILVIVFLAATVINTSFGFYTSSDHLAPETARQGYKSQQLDDNFLIDMLHI
jgi:hypothetical protein